MSHEHLAQPAPKRPYEIFGLTEKEALYWRVDDQRFQALLEDENTVVHKVHASTNNFGEFLFVTTTRPGEQERIAMTFYGLGYHQHRERWITDEWFWYQANFYPGMMEDQIDKKEAKELIQHRSENIAPYLGEGVQTEYGQIFEMLADLTDEDGALAEIEDLGGIAVWLLGFSHEESGPEEVVEQLPSGENLLDKASREKLPQLYSCEEKGLDALPQVKFFTPDSNWTWYATEFDGEDIFYGNAQKTEAGLKPPL